MTRALITRPLEDARSLADALKARGIEAVIEPLLTIAPRPDALPPLDDVRALLFTSANGVRAFAAASPRRDLPVFAVGPSTADTARAAGFATIATAEGDAEALAALVAASRSPADGKLLHVAGSTVSGDLAGRLAARGYDIMRVALYDAVPATALSLAVTDDLAAGRIDWVLLFSPRTAATFARLVRDAGRADALRACTALCLSPPVAEAVSSLPWHRVRIAGKPDQANLLALAENLRAEAAHEAATRHPPSPSSPAPTRAPRGAPIWPALAAAAAIVVVLVAVLAATAPLWRDLVLPTPTDTARLDALGARVDQLQRAPVPAGAAEQRVARVESELSQRIAGLAGELDTLRKRLGEAPAGADPQTVAELAARTSRLADQVKTLQERLGAAEQAQQQGAAERARAASFAIGVAELDDTARSGRPFTASLNALRALAPDAAAAELLQPLEPYAARGVASLERLKRDWPEAARRAQAAQVAATYEGWLGRVMALLESAVTIRRVGADVAGDDAEALLARAGARLEADDLAGALATLTSLPEPAARALKPWLDQARARRAVETALAQLTERALAGAARAGG